MTSLEVSAEEHVRVESALPVIILHLDYVVHDQPGPDMKISNNVN